MKIIAINASARKDWNTAKMIESFLEGVKSVAPDAEMETVQLQSLKYSD